MPSASAPRWRSPDAAKRFPTQLRAASRRSTQRIHAAPRRFATLRTASRRSAQRKVCSRGKTDSRVRQLLSTSELPGSPTGLPGSSKWNTFAKPCRTTVHYTGGSGEFSGPDHSCIYRVRLVSFRVLKVTVCVYAYTHRLASIWCTQSTWASVTAAIFFQVAVCSVAIQIKLCALLL